LDSKISINDKRFLIGVAGAYSRRMADVVARDWPQILKDQTIHELMARNKNFAERLSGSSEEALNEAGQR
jgi:hypothetical protein